MLWESGCGQFSFQLLISSQCVGDWFNNRVDKIQSLELDLWIFPYMDYYLHLSNVASDAKRLF